MKANSALLFGSVAVATLRNDGLSVFLFKVVERVRRADFPVVSRFLDRLRVGNKKLLGAAPPKPEETPVHPSVVKERLKRTPRSSVVWFLTNSYPFSKSGYAERSQQMLSAMHSTDISISPVTRLAYPFVVGQMMSTPTQRVGNVEYFRLIPRYLPANAMKRASLEVEMLVDFARAKSADLLHTTTDCRNASTVSRAAEILGIPWVYEVRGEPHNTWVSSIKRGRHDVTEIRRYRDWKQLEIESARAASGVVALSCVARDKLITAGVDAEKIIVLPNAVDDELVNLTYDVRSIRGELGLKYFDGDRVIGIVTSLVGYEGVDQLIRALIFLPSDVHALIVGEGTELPALRGLVRELQLEQRVTFVGHQPSAEIWKWYAALDVFVLSRKDTEVTRNVTPLKPLVALALGIPVVASDLPALREVTGEFAEYARPDDPGSLAEAISTQLAGRTDRKGMDEWLAQRTWQANAKRLHRFYARL